MLRAVDQRHFGVNLTMWDTYFDPSHHLTTISLLQEMGSIVVRIPGGSLSDQYEVRVLNLKVSSPTGNAAAGRIQSAGAFGKKSCRLDRCPRFG